MPALSQHNSSSYSAPFSPYSASERSFVDELSDYSDLPANILDSYPSHYVHHSSHASQIKDQGTAPRALRYQTKLQDHWKPSFSQETHSSHSSHPSALPSSIKYLDHDDLLCNKVYQDLYHKYLTIQSKLKSSQEALSILANTMQSGPSHNSSASSDTLFQMSSNALPAPLLQSNYPDVKFWVKRMWTGMKGQEVTDLNTTVGLRGQSRIAAGENVSFTFVESEEGVPSSGHRVRDITAAAREIWLELHKQGQAPATWGQGSATVRNFYRIEMYKRIPELRYCENHWKVDQIATATYSGWHRKHVLGIGKSVKKDNMVSESRDAFDSSEVKHIPEKRPPTSTLSSRQPKKFKIPALPQPCILTPSNPQEVFDEPLSTLSSPATLLPSGLLPSISPPMSPGLLSPLLHETGLQSLPTHTPVPLSPTLVTEPIPSVTTLQSTPITPIVSPEVLSSASTPIVAPEVLSSASTPIVAPEVLSSASTPPADSGTVLVMPQGTQDSPLPGSSMSTHGIKIVNPFEMASEEVATDPFKLSKIGMRTFKRLNAAMGTANTTASSEGATATTTTPEPPSSSSAVPTSTLSTSISKGKRKPAVKKERMMVPSTALVPKNLFAIDYCKNNSITKIAFDALWNSLDDATKQQYEELSVKTKKELKEAKVRALSAATNGRK